MAGFMSGFGSAFADSFNATRKREADRKDDMFQLQYRDLISKRDARTKVDQENAKNVKAAKAMVKLSGQPDEAWTEVYNLKSAGVSDAEIMKQLEANQAVISPNTTASTDTSGPADPRDDLTTAANNSVDSQMKASGMEPPKSGGIFGRIADAIGIDRNQDPNRAADGPETSPYDQTDRVAEASGMTPEEVRNTQNADVSGTPIPGLDDNKITWTPKASSGTAPDLGRINSEEEAQGAIDWYASRGMEKEAELARTMLDNQMKITESKIRADAIAKGTMPDITGGAIKNEDGTWTNVRKTNVNGDTIWTDGLGNQVDAGKVDQDTPAMMRDIDEMTKALDKPTQEYYTAANTLKTTAKAGTGLINIVEQYPEAVGLTNNLVQVFDKYKRGAQNIMSILNPTVDPETGLMVVSSSAFAKADSMEKDLENQLSGPLGRAKKVAIAAALVDIKTTKLAYAAAAQQGQTGKGVNQQEFEKFYSNIQAGGNPDAMRLGIAEILDEQRDNLSSLSNDLNKNSIYMRKFQQVYGRPSPFQPVEGPDELLKNDPELQKTFERFQGDTKNSPLNQAKQPQTPESTGMTPVGKTPDGKIVYQGKDGKRYVQ